MYMPNERFYLKYDINLVEQLALVTAGRAKGRARDVIAAPGPLILNF